MWVRASGPLSMLIAGVAVVSGLSFLSSTQATVVGNLDVNIREWDVPTKGAHPHDPAVAPDGSLWFTEQMVSKLGRLDPATGNFKEYALKGQNDGPHGLVADREGNIWYTGNFAAHIGKLDPRTGEVTQYKMPNDKAQDPHTAVFDAQGILWFTVQVGNMVGRLQSKTGKIDLKLMPTKEARPYGIQINSKGIPFFCEFGTNKMAKIDPKTMEITEYPLAEGVRPRRLAIAADDSVYFTDYQSGNLGRLDPCRERSRCGLLPADLQLRRMELRSPQTAWSGIASPV